MHASFHGCTGELEAVEKMVGGPSLVGVLTGIKPVYCCPQDDFVETRLPRPCSPRGRVQTTKPGTLHRSGYVLSNVVLESHLAPPRRPTERTCPKQKQKRTGARQPRRGPHNAREGGMGAHARGDTHAHTDVGGMESWLYRLWLWSGGCCLPLLACSGGGSLVG
jgi:hypothetical protein